MLCINRNLINGMLNLFSCKFKIPLFFSKILLWMYNDTLDFVFEFLFWMGS